jgi:hypothetical protein
MFVYGNVDLRFPNWLGDLLLELLVPLYTYHDLMVAEATERLFMTKQATQNVYG